MNISLIAAFNENRVIGCDNQIPWYLPADLKYFKEKTMGKPVVMGRKTFESIGKPLPGRRNIILTRNLTYIQNGIECFNSLDELKNELKDETEVMVIGGEEIYRLFLPLASKLYLTLVHNELSGDSFFPDFDVSKWTLISEEVHEADEKNAFAYRFLVYVCTDLI